MTIEWFDVALSHVFWFKCFGWLALLATLATLAKIGFVAAAFPSLLRPSHFAESWLQSVDC
jgi:hypothetical protein